MEPDRHVKDLIEFSQAHVAIQLLKSHCLLYCGLNNLNDKEYHRITELLRLEGVLYYHLV